MGLMDQLNSVLQQYANNAGSGQAPAQVNQHFDQVAEVAPKNVVAEGLASAFRSSNTPEFGHMLGSLFSQSNGDQKAGILNQLVAAVGPGMLSQLLGGGGGGLASLLSGGSQLTSAQAQQVSPEVVQQLAAHAEKSDPSIIDRASSFYAEHPALVKTLGGAALTIAMAKMAEKTKA
jgi:hypothetical protein